GNIGQSVVVQKLKERFLGSEPINRISIKESTLNSFTYYFAGIFIFTYMLILHKIIVIIISLSL
ncbi:MAG: hypothetical protein ACTSPI_13350, partial [Candidatus Heimdallarchaeaceae archaeon]